MGLQTVTCLSSVPVVGLLALNVVQFRSHHYEVMTCTTQTDLFLI